MPDGLDTKLRLQTTKQQSLLCKKNKTKNKNKKKL